MGFTYGSNVPGFLPDSEPTSDRGIPRSSGPPPHRLRRITADIARSASSAVRLARSVDCRPARGSPITRAGHLRPHMTAPTALSRDERAVGTDHRSIPHDHH